MDDGNWRMTDSSGRAIEDGWDATDGSWRVSAGGSGVSNGGWRAISMEQRVTDGGGYNAISHRRQGIEQSSFGSETERRMTPPTTHSPFRSPHCVRMS